MPLRPVAALLVALLPLAVAASADDIQDAFAAMKARAASAPRPAAAPPPSERAPRGVDLSVQTGYPNGAPDQGALGDCHAFGATALINAAYYRAYRTSVRFSPGDLFIQSVVLTPQMSAFLHQESLGPTEGGDAASDVNVALESGLASEAVVPYARFAKDYANKILTSYRRDALRTDKAGLLTKLANMEELAKIKSDQGDPNAYQAYAAEWAKADAAEHEKFAARVRKLLGARWPEVVDERARHKLEFARAGFALVSKTFPDHYSAALLPADEGVPPSTMLEGWDMKPENCLSAGRPQAEYLVSELDAGRPVAVSFDLQQFKEWGQGSFAEGDGYHVFIIDGYASTGGELSFKTLNSWGGAGNRPVPQHALCRVMSATSVRVASDPR